MAHREYTKKEVALILGITVDEVTKAEQSAMKKLKVWLIDIEIS